VRIALDTNVMAYAEGVGDDQMRLAAFKLVGSLPRASVVLPVQTLGELFNVLVRKGRRSREDARAAVIKWRDDFALVETSVPIIIAAADLATDHRLGIWDAVMLSAAAHAGCRLLLSEDLQEGFTWHGVTVANPFLPAPNPLLAELLADRQH
jgi:predicted nucleic acid-binding protein